MFQVFENEILNILTIFVLFIFSMIVVLYAVLGIVKILPILRSAAIQFSQYIYLFLIPAPLFYLFYYYVFYEEGVPETYLLESQEITNYLRDVSLIVFTGGIFSAAVKLINSLVIFRKNFERIIMSEKFDEMLTNKLELLTFSNEHLSKLNNLEGNWKKLTLCKYEQRFPELMNKLRNNLENELFQENNLTCYYKHFDIRVKIELLKGHLIRITELASFTIVPNSNQKIDIKFWVSSVEEDNEEVYTKLLPEKTEINGTLIENKIKELENLERETHSVNNFRKNFEFTLEGETEYHIERGIEMAQDLRSDRLYSFSSSKIIDDISVEFEIDDALDIFFSTVGKNKFTKNNKHGNSLGYYNRDVLLPGEKFNVFIFKK